MVAPTKKFLWATQNFNLVSGVSKLGRNFFVNEVFGISVITGNKCAVSVIPSVQYSSQFMSIQLHLQKDVLDVISPPVGHTYQCN